MEDKLTSINQYLGKNSHFVIPLRTRKLLYYSKEQPKNVGSSTSFTISFNVQLDDHPITEESLNEEIEQIKNGNPDDGEILERIREKIKVNVNCDQNDKEEPSLIYLSLPITKPLNIKDEENPGYYPCYALLTPEQRWIYFDWLQDISKPIHKSYVYLYYYGLERRMLNDDNMDTIDELLFLSKFHYFIRRDIHSVLLFTYFRSGNIEILKKLHLETVDYPVSNLILILYYSMKRSLTSKDIFELISQYGYVNRRYLKLHPQIYLQELDNYLCEKYDVNGFPFFKYYPLHKFSLEHRYTYLNYSFPDEIRSADIYNIAEFKEFKNDILNIHQTIHEKVKERLKRK
jgi:hypothetical protein